MRVSKKQVSFVLILAVLVISIGLVSANHNLLHRLGLGGSGNLTINCEDKDNDGYDTCGPILGDGKPKDCLDSRIAGKNVNPGHKEVCGDGFDNDCDGQTDEGCGNGKSRNKSDSSCSWTELKNNDNPGGEGDSEKPSDLSGVCERPVDVECVADVPKKSQMRQGMSLDDLQKNYAWDRINPNTEKYFWLNNQGQSFSNNNQKDVLDPSWYKKNSAWSYDSGASRTVNYSKTGENVTCSASKGVVCKDSEQSDGECDYNYRVKFKCCDNISCLDKDGGKNISNSSSGIEYYTENGVNKTISSMSDTCATNTSVNEVYCSGRSLNTENISCSSDEKCVGGECVQCNYTLVNSSNITGEEWKQYANNLRNTGFTTNKGPVSISSEVASFNSNASVSRSVAVANGYVYVASRDNHTYQLNASNLNLVSSFKANDAFIGPPTVYKGHVYVGNDNGKLYKLKASEISQKVDSYLGYGDTGSNGYTPWGPAKIRDGYLYVQNTGKGSVTGGELLKIDVSGMNLVNSLTTFGRHMDSAPAFNEDYVYVNSHFKGILQLNATNFNLVHKIKVGPGEDSSPVLNNGYLYVGQGNSGLLQLNASNISQKIAQFGSSGDRVYSTPVFSDGRVYVEKNSEFFSLNASNVSDMVSVYSLRGSLPSSHAPAISEDYIYLFSGADELVQLDASSLSLVSLYSDPTSRPIFSSPVVANGHVYVTGDDKVYMLGNQSRICHFGVSEPGSGQGGNSEGGNSVDSTNGESGLDAPGLPQEENEEVPEVQNQESQGSFIERLLTGSFVREIFN